MFGIGSTEILLFAILTAVRCGTMATEATAMDDEVTQLLREIRDLQIKQLEMLKAALLPAWLRWRFSLNSLLIFMTVVALLLGALVWLRTARSVNRPMAVPSPTAPFVR